LAWAVIVLKRRQTSAKRGRVSVSKTTTSPVGGLNALNPLADMPQNDAIVLDNWFPRTSDVVTRNGSQIYTTGMGSPVETLMAYRTGTAQSLFGIAGGAVWNCTNAGAPPAALVTGLQNSRFQYSNFGTVGGRFLYAVNGVNYPLLYDGTTWLSVGNGIGAAISSITFAGTTATVTTAVPHGLANGGLVTVTVAAAVPSSYNVAVAPINVLTATTFTYVMATTPATNATTVGTFTYTPSIQGVDPRLFRNCGVIDSRLWFVESGSLRAWYLPLLSIGGQASAIDLSSMAQLGGALAGVFPFSTTSVYGMTNFTVFLTTEGEVFAYAGYDPTNAATWSLSAKGRVGAPVGDRFYTQIGSDVAILGRDGIIPFSKGIQIDRMAENIAISYKIVNLINNDIATYRANFGWQVLLFPLSNMLIVNVPALPDVSQYQYVMNTITGAWCRYTGLNANCWEYINDTLFFGGDDGNTYQAEIGNNDNGAPIFAIAKQAFSYLDDPGSQKRITAVRPVISASSTAKVTFDVNMDFDDRPPSSAPQIAYPQGNPTWSFVWGVAWGAQAAASHYIQFAGGVGYAVAAKVTATTKIAPISWQASTYSYERGGPL
jgi:hypothetical protein